jgi:hypothetical protein
MPGDETNQRGAGRVWVRARELARLVADPSPYPWRPEYSALDVRAQVYAWLCRGREVLWFDESEW